MAVWPLPRITFRELSSIEEKRPVALLTSDDVWAVLSTQLTLPVVIQAEPARYDRELFEMLADNLPAAVKAVYAVGSGAPVMAGKMIAARRDVPLVIVPTALESDWMLTPEARIEETVDDEIHVVWEETGPASEVIIDWGIIQSAPEDRRTGGMVDVISIVTGLLDWRYAAKQGKNPREQRFEPWAASIAAGLASQAIKSAAAVGQADQHALQTLLNLMMTAVQLSNQLGHTRAQHGSEHYLAQILSTVVEGDLPHAAIVAPCLLFVSALHGQAPAALRAALEQAGVPLDRLRATDVALVLELLDGYLDRYDLPYSILNDIEPGSEQVTEALEAAGLAMPAESWQLSDSQRMAAVDPEAVEPEAAEPVVADAEPAAEPPVEATPTGEATPSGEMPAPDSSDTTPNAANDTGEMFTE